MRHTSTYITSLLTDTREAIATLSSRLNKYRRYGMDCLETRGDLKTLLMFYEALAGWEQNEDGSVDDDVENCITLAQKSQIIDQIRDIISTCPAPDCPTGYIDSDHFDDEYIDECEL